MDKKNSKNEWEITFDALPDLIMILDRNNRIIKANRAMAEKLGCAQRELKGRPCYKTVHGFDEPPEWCPHTRLLTDGMAHRVEAPVSFLGGEFMVSVFPLLDDNGAPWGCVHVARDITDMKRVEKELKRAHDEMDQRVRQRTLELSEAKERLARQAKKLGKSQDELSERVRFEEFLANLSAKFAGLPAERVGEEVIQGLKLLVEYLNIDRSTLLEFSSDFVHLKVLYSYARKGFEPLPSIDVTKKFPWSASKIKRKEIFILNSLDEFPPEAATDRRSFEEFGIKSNLSIPIFFGDSPVYLIAFGSIAKERVWPLELIPRLRLFGELLTNSVIRKNADEKLRRAVEELTTLKRQLEAESAYLRHEIKLEHNFENIIGQSKALKYVLFRIERVAKTETPVLIMGETGTGKELAARAVHSLGNRSNRPLIKVNCAALPAGLIESELFGHEKGAFTGALSTQVGRFELAKGSTLFLDEIGELPFELQAKLLRVLEGGEFERIGSTKTLKTDARIIASTNRDLEAEIKHGRFRSDLWYRLRVYPITMPPLREREDDIVLLVQHFLEKFTRLIGKSMLKIRKKTLRHLMNHPWPGNIRELRHTIESAVISSQGNYLQLDLPDTSTEKKIKPKTLRDLEHDHIVQVLETTRWKIHGPGGAASILDIHPNTLRSRMEKLGIRKDFSG